MTFSLKHLLGSVAIAALVTVAACDQNEEEKAADATTEEAPAVDNAVPMTAEPGAVDSAVPEGDMPDSSMPGSEMDESDMSMGEEAAAEGADAETITGAANEAAAGCQAAADALGVWIGKSYDEAKGDIEAGEGVATIRVIRPDQAVTQDFRPDRLNVELDAEDNVTRIYCG